MAKGQKGTTPETRRFRASLVQHQLNRDATNAKDSRLVNCFVESLKNDITEAKKAFLVKRSGLSQIYSIGAGVGRGLAYFNGKHYSVIGTGVYENTTLKYTLSTSTGPVGFVEYDIAGVSALFLCDGTNGYSIDTAGTVTQVNSTYSAWVGSTNYSMGDKVVPTVANGYYYTVTTDAGSSAGSQPTWPTTVGLTVVDGGITWTCSGSYGGFPTPHIPIPLFIDGYLVLAKEDTADIYNSDLDNVYAWGSSNFVTAEMWPDNLKSLARQNNMIVAFGHLSTEFFYNNANASGSPFNRYDAGVIQTGIAAPYALYQNEKFCIYVGQSESGGRCAWLIEGFQPKRISTEYVEKILDAEGTSLATARGFGLRTQGHLFYIINLTNISLVYDVEEKMWHEWSSNSSGTHTRFGCLAMADPAGGKASLLHESNGKIYSLDPSTYQDDGISILTNPVTTKYDFDLMDRKFMHSLDVVGDLTTGDTIDIRWSDDDYRTWSSWKTLNMSPRAYFKRLGHFRRRAFELLHTGNYPLRLEALEFEVDIGVN